MPTPRLEIRLDRLTHNARELAALFGGRGVGLTAVTKGVCGSPEIARALCDGGIHSLADSRLTNIRRLRRAGIVAEYMLTRSPRLSEVGRVVELADVSLNTELGVIRSLGRHAAQRGRAHRVILMVELGDLREGILPANLDWVVAETLRIEGVKLAGIGTNLGCFGGIRPTAAKMRQLSALAGGLRRRFDTTLPVISGGNSANYRWFASGADLGLVNHLRIGEAMLLGCDSLSRRPIPGLYTDAFTLVAEVIELKVKPSQPYGEVAQDAFGHVPEFEEEGPMRRAILAIGKQDTMPSHLRPRQPVRVLGASSDHLVIDAQAADLRVGSEVAFDVGYGALLRAMTSPYVEKVYLNPAVPLPQSLREDALEGAE